MSFTAYRTWVSGEVVTAAIMNAQIRDDGVAITGASTSFSPTWTGSGGGSGAVGTGGSFVGLVRQDSKWLDVTYLLTLGSSGFSFPTGGWQFSLPTGTPRNLIGNWSGRAYDSSVSTTQGYPVTVDMASASVSVRCAGTVAGGGDRQINTTNPFTWAANDVLWLTGRYEIA